MANKVLQAIKSFFGLGNYEDDYEEELAEEPYPPKRRKPLLRLYSRREEEIFIKFPKSIEDAKTVADDLKDRRSVIINLIEATEEEARRIVDFISGVTYAIDGHIERVADSVFLSTPSHIFITTHKS